MAAVIVYVNSDDFRVRLIDVLNRNIDGRIALSNHKISLPSGRLTLVDAVLRQQDGELIASVEKVSVHLFWPSLLRRAIHIRSVNIQGGRLVLIQNGEGQLNLLQAVGIETTSKTDDSAEDSSFSWQVIVKKLRLRQIDVDYQCPSKRQTVIVRQLDVEGQGNLKRQRGKVKMTLGRVEVKTPEITGAADAVTAMAAYEPDAEKPISLTITSGLSTANVKADIDWQSNPIVLNASADLDIDLLQVSPWLPVSIDLTGRVRGQITAQGSIFDPAATAALTLTDISVDAFKSDRLNLQANLAQRKISIEEVTLNGHWGTLDLTGSFDLQPVFPSDFQQAVAGIDAAVYQLTVRLRDFNPRQLSDVQWPVGGTYNGTIELQGSGVTPSLLSATGNVDLSGNRFGGAPLSNLTGKLTAAFSVDKKIVAVEESRAALGNSDLVLQGTIDLERLYVDIAGYLAVESLPEIGNIVGEDLPEGRASARFNCTGEIGHPDVEINLLAQGLALKGWRFGDLSAQVHLSDDGNLAFANVLLQNGSGKLNASGRLGLLNKDGSLIADPSLAFSADISQMALKNFKEALPVDVSLNGRIKAGGTLKQPTAQLTVLPSKVVWQDLALDVSGKAGWKEGALDVRQLLMSRGESAALIQGSAQFFDRAAGQWHGDPMVDASLTAKSLKLVDFFADNEGQVAVKANLKGPATELKGPFSIDGKSIVTPVQKADTVTLHGRMENNIIHLERLLIELAPDQLLSGNGWFSLADTTFEAALAAESLDVGAMDFLPKETAIGGIMELSLAAGGSVRHPVATGTLRIKEVKIKEQALDDFNLSVQLDDQLLSVTADLNFQLKGNCRLDSGDFEVSARFDQTDLGPYLAVGAGPKWAGRLSGVLDAAGNWHAFNRMRGSANLRDGSLFFSGMNLMSFDAVDAQLADGSLTLPETRMTIMHDGFLIVSAHGHVDRRLSLRAEGRYPLAALDPLTEAISEAGGTVEISLQGNGPLRHMAWQGNVALEQVHGRLAELGIMVQGLNGRIHLTPDRITIEQVSGRVEDGQLSLDGVFALQDGHVKNVNATLKARALPLYWPDTMDMKIGADFSLTGDNNRMLLDGRLVFLEGAYYKNLKIDYLSVIKEPLRPAPVRSMRQPPEWLERVALNITVTHRYPLLVDNNMAQLEISPDLKITGTAARPIVNGRADASDGEVYFRQKTFTVKRGVVDFVNPYKIEPSLDIVAETTIRQWLITLEISGTPDNLVVELRSEPSESNADILSLILLGQTSSEFSEGGANGNGSTTGQMLATLLASSLGEEIKKGTGLDILEVETGAQTDDQSSDRIQMTVGKKVSPRLTLKYALESQEQQMVHRAISEYRLLEHFSASGFQDTLGKYGGELVFRIEFR